MAQLIVRNVDAALVRKLKERAAAHGRSAEAEHRRILEDALVEAESFKTLVRSMPDVGRDDDFMRSGDKRRRRVRL
jgi:plasmid stability protein